jgi:hypothetical protein
MKRRAFITLLGGAAAAWPLMARAQHGKVRRIGVVSGASRETAFSNYEGFLQGMRELGYVEKRDFVMEYRFAEGKYERFPNFAAEFVRLNVDVFCNASDLKATIIQYTQNSLDARYLGNKLGTDKNKIAGGLCLRTKYDSHRKVNCWYVEKI